MIRRIALLLTQHVDGFLLAVLSLTMLLGLVVLYSATGGNMDRVLGQVVSIVVALSIMWAVANLPPQHMMRFAWPTYVLGLLLLVGVALFGEVSHGARRWLHVGVARI